MTDSTRFSIDQPHEQLLKARKKGELMKRILLFTLICSLFGACSKKQSSADSSGNCTQESILDYNKIVLDYQNFSAQRSMYNKDIKAKRKPRVKLSQVCGSARNLESSANAYLAKYGEGAQCKGVVEETGEEVVIDGKNIAAARDDIQNTINTHCK